jgi:aspartate/methionine/tyrosine aminotransferase
MSIKVIPARIQDQAARLNDIIASSNPEIVDLFTEAGKRAHVDKNGIIKQAQEAARDATTFNATIGISLDANKEPLVFEETQRLFKKMRIPLKKGIVYGSSDGLLSLRQRLRDQLGIEGAGLPVITSGLTNSLSNVGQLFCDQNMPVVMHSFAWENTPRIYQDMFGCRFVAYPFYNDQRNGFNLKGMAAAIEYTHHRLRQPRAMVYLNFPNNPTGYNLTEAEGKGLRDVFVDVLESNTKLNLLALTDEAYFGYSYAGATDKPIMSYLVNAHPRLLVVGAKGPTKEVNVWGLRVGALHALPYGMNPNVIAALGEKFAGVTRAIISTPSTLGQEITERIYTSHAYLDNCAMIKRTLRRRADRVQEILASPAYQKHMPVYPFNAGYFCSVQVPDAEAVRQDLLKNGGGVIAGYENNDASLQGDQILRLAFSSLPVSKIPMALEKTLASVKRCAPR